MCQHTDCVWCISWIVSSWFYPRRPQRAARAPAGRAKGAEWEVDFGGGAMPLTFNFGEEHIAAPLSLDFLHLWVRVSPMLITGRSP